MWHPGEPRDNVGDVKAGSASVTARRVAAYRAGFSRVQAAFGDPAADDRLQLHLASMVEGELGARMGRYLEARTRFFDRVTVDSLATGVTQVVVAGAGYDGRSLRYGMEGVRWFEVDHPDTQADKRELLAELAIDSSSVTFVSADFRDADLGSSLVRAGYDVDKASLVLCEGVAVYLEPRVLESLLTQLRSVAAPKSRLAISFSVATSEENRESKKTFEDAVASLGEPAHGMLDPDQASGILHSAGWSELPLAGGARAAGLVLAEPRES